MPVFKLILYYLYILVVVPCVTVAFLLKTLCEEFCSFAERTEIKLLKALGLALFVCLFLQGCAARSAGPGRSSARQAPKIVEARKLAEPDFPARLVEFHAAFDRFIRVYMGCPAYAMHLGGVQAEGRGRGSCSLQAGH